MRVDFYEMGGRFTDPLYVAGVLVSKAWPEERDIAVVGQRDNLARLDEQLWETFDGRFLPHERDGASAPIKLLEAAPEAAGILINLDPATPLPAGRFRRVLEIVPPDESLKQQLRERWLAWKQRGAELQHHVLK
jgi:DNA polymerase-3 subunit chi